MNREALARPFDRRLVRHRAGPRGRTVPYVEVAAVVERLNAEVPSWSYEVVSHDVYDDREVVVLGRLSVPADGIVKMAFGTAELTRDRDGNVPSKGAALKAAASDGLKKAASLLGVGLEFYRKESTPEERPAPPARPSRPQPVSPATQRQLAALESAVRRRGWSADRFGAWVMEKFGKKDATTLSRSEASTLISELSRPGSH